MIERKKIRYKKIINQTEIIIHQNWIFRKYV